MKPVLANLGFIMQITGIFTLIPVLFAVYLEDYLAIAALSITSLIFFATGFAFNSLCERKALNYKSSCILIVLAFILLGIIGTIPYIYLEVFDGDILTIFTNSFFESISGFTTTGHSMLPMIENFNQPVILYRGITQFLGGMVIVFILLVFLYPRKNEEDFEKAFGIDDVKTAVKETFLKIFLVYIVLTLAFILVFHFLTGKGIAEIATFMFTGMSTGGFIPSSDIKNIATSFPGNIFLPISMLLGATSFWIYYKLPEKRFRSIVHSELPYFYGFIILMGIFVTLYYNLEPFTAFFHVISASSTTGFSFIDLANMENSLKLIFICLMLIGGASFSTAGGIKIAKIVLMIKSIPYIINRMLTKKPEPLKLWGREIPRTEIETAFIFTFIAVICIFVSSLIFVFYGYDFINSLFDVTSAISTTGLSTDSFF